ncbi:8864_t:CDS:2 [Cetraspora pellucida]|uniref:8864_t:CDS:1 n=1 Tax=Cetraspora pellucida TaxID=1433469 RepID=A0A9N9F534_9GLOM|nr:8864_t:CDS:2 [Cetraspora pellucida]
MLQMIVDENNHPNNVILAVSKKSKDTEEDLKVKGHINATFVMSKGGRNRDRDIEQTVT